MVVKAYIMRDMFKKVARALKDNSVIIGVLCEVFSPSTPAYKNEENESAKLNKNTGNRDNTLR